MELDTIETRPKTREEMFRGDSFDSLVSFYEHLERLRDEEDNPALKRQDYALMEAVLEAIGYKLKLDQFRRVSHFSLIDLKRSIIKYESSLCSKCNQNITFPEEPQGRQRGLQFEHYLSTGKSCSYSLGGLPSKDCDHFGK